jgi:hypothetical protein
MADSPEVALTGPPSDGIFRSTASVARSFVARASLVVTTAVRATVAFYTNLKCPSCERVVIAVPGDGAKVELRVARTVAERSGRGPVLSCKRCSSLIEIIAHG